MPISLPQYNNQISHSSQFTIHNSQYEKYLSTFFLIIKIVRENGLQENETDE